MSFSSFRCLEGTGCPYHYDRYSDCPAVVHLWLSQGLLPSAPPPSTWDARIPEEEAWPDRVKALSPPFSSLHWAAVSFNTCRLPTPTAHTAVFYIYVISSHCSAEHRCCYYSCVFKNKGGKNGTVTFGLPRVDMVYFGRNTCLVLSFPVIR